MFSNFNGKINNRKHKNISQLKQTFYMSSVHKINYYFTNCNYDIGNFSAQKIVMKECCIDFPNPSKLMITTDELTSEKNINSIHSFHVNDLTIKTRV